MEQLNKLKAIIAELEKDTAKFYNKGNQAAGVRIRKTLKKLTIAAHEFRVDTLKMDKL